MWDLFSAKRKGCRKHQYGCSQLYTISCLYIVFLLITFLKILGLSQKCLCRMDVICTTLQITLPALLSGGTSLQMFFCENVRRILGIVNLRGTYIRLLFKCSNILMIITLIAIFCGLYVFRQKTWIILTFYLKVCTEICYMIKLL